MGPKMITVISLLCTSVVGSVNAGPPKSDAQQFLAELNRSDAQAIESQASGRVQTNNPHIILYGATVRNSAWPSSNIFVCWEQADGDIEAKQWVRDAIERTWSKHSALVFKGWGLCGAQNAGIRISVEDSGPHVKTIGRRLDRMKDGMVLNFTFNTWSPSCAASAKRKSCIESIAVHEFGHAIGLVHEQNRPDAPGECQALRQATDPNVLLTPYDPASVMNYCNETWNNDGRLSALDIEAAQVLYGTRTAS